MRIVDISTAQQEKIKLEITYESHNRLIRAREVAANIYKYLEAGEAEFKPIPWPPEILDYLCKDIDVILHEIDKLELRNSLSNTYLFKENNLQEPCHD
ncbi:MULTISPECIES: hypothetical protein [Symbiopectobacterium]|uniref:hypothetical protein n=1 Tax=Symbiopectobacterium TaxID=801 RepID=UPI001A2F0B1D|nr:MULTISPECIES: hypothetical protein [Symbiopectobacterium]MBG6249465.1 hypothetical protein [Candidatus Symbiopectobacterium sp. PLON1]MBT9428898.1 hypothetical protein [Candidatus Symbiopectobacterium endolongispinus]